MIKTIFLTGLSFLWAMSASAKSLPFPIIDAHVHLNFEGKKESSGIMYSKEEFVREAKELGVTGFVCHTHDASDPEATIPDMSGFSSAFCAGIGDKFNLSMIEEGLKNKKYACIKIYLGYVYRYAYDEAYKPLYRLAEKYKVPVVFHTGDTETPEGKVKYADPLTIDEVAVDFRNVNLVIAHVGNPWIQSAAEVIYKNSNVYGDVSAQVIGDLHGPASEYKLLVIDPLIWMQAYIENADKLMYGTDWPLVDMKQYFNIIKKSVAKKDQKKFFHDNAAKLFNLK